MTDRPTFTIQQPTLQHWQNILLTDKTTDTGQAIYEVASGEYTLSNEEGEEATFGEGESLTVNGVTRNVRSLDVEGKQIQVSLEDLQVFREELTTSKTMFGAVTMNNLYMPLLKSLMVACLTTVVAIIIAAPASYVISRMPRMIAYAVVLALLVTRMFPDVGIALPIATRFISWGFIDSTFGLVLAHLIPNLPFLAWILVGTFMMIPKDLEESAMVDGGSRITALVRIVFPVAMPGIAVGAIFVWLNSWNEFIFARYLSTESGTLPLRIYEVITNGSIFPAAAYSMILTIPVIFITFLLQRYLKSGMLSGAVKG
nr:carbohydrate ABC transporter permease [Alteribacter salitolerans]